jgi:hypothetical protein
MYMREKETLIGETSITLHYGKDDYNTIHDLMGRINSCIAEGTKLSE